MVKLTSGLLKHLFFALIMISHFSCSNALFGADVTVESAVDQAEAYASEPLKGTVTVTHEQNLAVDAKSFYLDKNKIPVQLVKEVKLSPDSSLILSIYSFKLPGKTEGLYALPAVSVSVGGTVYKSSMSSYSVQSAKDAAKTKSANSSNVPAIQLIPGQSSPSGTANETADSVKPLLRLEASVNGSSSLYPGQRTKLVYRYFFSGKIDLTVEKLPLLDATGLTKIGEKEFNNFSQGASVSVTEISQQVEAEKPGNYSFGPSKIEGYTYKEDAVGNPVHTSDKLSSEAAPVVITVLPFPEKNKPASFNGAVGIFVFKTSLISPAEMSVGDEISLLLEVSGKGNLKNIMAPDLCCQPGFSGFFRFSDLPPAEEIEGEVKKITVKLRPMNQRLLEIPEVEFSFFEPETALYAVLHSAPIPIRVKLGAGQVESIHEIVPKKTAAFLQESQLKNFAIPAPLEIVNLPPLASSDLYNRLFGSWWTLTILPLGILLAFYQKHLKDYLLWKRSQRPSLTARERLEQSFSGKKLADCNFNQLKKALKLGLVQAGLIPSVDIPDKEMPDVGLIHEVKVFWAYLDEKRYASNGSVDSKEIRCLSLDLLDKMAAVSKSNHGVPS